MMRKAKRQSSNEFQRRQLVSAHHYERLDNILASNELERVDVPPYGDCFFAAVLTSITGMNPEQTATNSLRSKVCKHLNEKKNHYKIEGINDNYENDIDSLKTPGHWDCEIADSIPLVMANMTGRPLRIFSSDVNIPILDVHPDIVDVPTLEKKKPIYLEKEKPIYLAYLKVPNEEHYDAVQPKKGIQCTALDKELYTKLTELEVQKQKLETDRKKKEDLLLETAEMESSTPRKRVKHDHTVPTTPKSTKCGY
ncbi:unnamed protein product [Owenia fusiformis]|uniref:OTU domain-containing protein n=1 Tax=Owenia fusiformis TaxID=6347 RepID=A0A8S4Q6P3_OWEFU|nr:unnamed protein product [Owenia fusiformis]